MSRMLARVLLVLAVLAGASGPAAATSAPAPPPAGARADYQLGGAYRPAAGVRIVVRDRTARPSGGGRYDVCYVNAFQTQPGSTRWWRRHHPRALLRDGAGGLVSDPGWPGERLLDTSTPARRAEIAAVVGGWTRGCARAGFDAVEPDNLDSWTRSGGRLTRADAVALARLVVRQAHAAGLAVAQKNAAGLATAGPSIGFDFAVAEECGVYHECGAYRRAYGGRVLEVEYADRSGRRAFARACRTRAAGASIVLRDHDLAPRGGRGHVARWC